MFPNPRIDHFRLKKHHHIKLIDLQDNLEIDICVFFTRKVTFAFIVYIRFDKEVFETTRDSFPFNFLFPKERFPLQ